MVHGVWAHRTLLSLSLHATAHGVQVVNVFHFEASAVEEATLTSDQEAFNSAKEMADDWFTTQLAPWGNNHGQEYLLQMVRAQVLERPTLRNHRLTAYERTSGLPAAGAITPAAENTTASAVVRWRSSLAGKSHRGRTYIGPIVPAWQDNGLLTSAATTSLNNWISIFATKYASAAAPATPWALTIYSRPYDKYDYSYVTGSGQNRQVVFPEDYDGNSTNVLTGSLDSVLRVQRRREIGVGA